MIRMAILLLSLTAIAPASVDDEVVLRWNQFAEHANRFVHSVDANSERRQRDKEKLKREFEAVYPLL